MTNAERPNYISRLKTDMEKCFRCSLCKMIPLPTVKNPYFTDACPSSRLFNMHGYSCSGKQIMALSYLAGRVEADERMAKIVFACSACGFGDVACKFIMDAERQRVNQALKRALVDAGQSPQPHVKIMENLAGSGYKCSSSAWSKGLDVKRAPAKAEVLLYAGCAGSSGSAKKLAALLKAAGVDFVVDDDEKCCGIVAYQTGNADVFTKVASTNLEKFEALGVKTVVTASGSCLGAFRSKYPEYARATKVEFLHATEFLNRLVANGALKLTKSLKKKVSWHDPCYLGRQSEPYVKFEGEEKIALGVMTYTEPPKVISYGTKGVYDAPRNLIKAIPGIEFRELHRIREYSWCCGAGGAVPETYPELAQMASEHRLEEAADIGTEILATGCVKCVKQLNKAQTESGFNSKYKIPVADVIDLVHDAAGLGA